MIEKLPAAITPTPFARGPRVDLFVVGRAHAARADDDRDAALERREDVLLDDGGVRVVDEDVGGDRVERLGDRRVAGRVRA